MARRKRVYRKIERRDPRYDSALVGKLISKVMLDGKRSLAERIVYAAIDMANEGTDSIDPLEGTPCGSKGPPRRWRYLPGSA